MKWKKISMYKNVCVQIWKPGNNHSTKLNIIAIFPNYCIIPIQSMHDFLIHKIHIWKWKKEFRKFGWILNEIDLNVAQQYGRVWFNQSKKRINRVRSYALLYHIVWLRNDISDYTLDCI